MTAGTGHLGQDNRTVQPRQYSHDSTAMTVHLGQNIWDMTSGVTMGGDSLDRSVWTSRHERSALTGQLGQDRTTWTGLPASDREDRTERTGRPGHGS
jgi:hypothetical protein